MVLGNLLNVSHDVARSLPRFQPHVFTYVNQRRDRALPRIVAIGGGQVPSHPKTRCIPFYGRFFDFCDVIDGHIIPLVVGASILRRRLANGK